MKKGAIILLVTVLISGVVTPLISASDKVYDGTITDIGPDGEYPVRITYRYSRRRNASRMAGLCDGLTLDDLHVGMAVKWTSLSGGRALIVGPLPEDPKEEPPSPKKGIKRIVVEVENERGESLTFELGEDDYRVEDADLEIDFRADVSELLEPVHEKTVMFVTHISMDPQPVLDVCLDVSRFNVWKWNYMFLDFPVWGEYFSYQTPDQEINERIWAFEELGFSTVLYVDLTESHVSISGRWGDSVIESGDWWSLMTLDPSKSWSRYLKAGMLEMTERFPAMDGFAIDRLDRCRSEQEELWAAQLLDEVREEAGIPVKYVMNSLQPWMTGLASRAAFIGSDGVETKEPYLTQTIRDYERLASHAEVEKFYINPYMGKSDEELIDDFEAILEVHDFVFMDDYYLRLLSSIFPG
jgi:hypothetical protein